MIQLPDMFGFVAATVVIASKLAILSASLISGIIGFFYLKRVL